MDRLRRALELRGLLSTFHHNQTTRFYSAFRQQVSKDDVGNYRWLS